MTSSASFFRRRPWSTKTQVSRSPTAWWTRVATTAESTPPESPHTIPASPTVSRIRRTARSPKSSRFQSASARHTRKRKLARSSDPCSVWATSGWNWRP